MVTRRSYGHLGTAL